MERAQSDNVVAADALLAFVRGEDPEENEEAFVGAYLVAEFLALVRSLKG